MATRLKFCSAIGIISILMIISCLCGDVLASRTLNAHEHYSGVAFLASNIGKDITSNEILDFVNTCRINLVVIDFAWITYHWNRTEFRIINDLIAGLVSRGVEVAVMYRPRVLRPSEAKVHYAVKPDGTTPKHHNELCFAYDDSVTWSVNWGTRVLKEFPVVNKIILYNLCKPCFCEKCQDGRSEKNVANFLKQCRIEWEKTCPDVQIGHVGVGVEYQQHLDFFCPFLCVNKMDGMPVDILSSLTKIKNFKTNLKNKPVIPLAKICWSSSTNNTTEDIVNTIEKCNQRKLGFILWYYSWIFHSTDGRYKPEPIVSSLGGDYQKLSGYNRRNNTLTYRSSNSFDKDQLDRLILELSTPKQGDPPFTALNKIIQIGKPAVPILIKEMKTSANWQIPKALGAIGDRRAFLPLKKKLEECNWSPMREVITEALELIKSRNQQKNKSEASMDDLIVSTASVPDLTLPYEEKRFEKLPWPHQSPELSREQIEKLNQQVWVINDFPLYQSDEQGNWRYFHGAFDIILDNGTKIYAIKDGWVKAISGSAILIGDAKNDQPSYGWEYTHLSNFQVKTGDFVKKGTFIGEVNFHGLPHIHLAKVFSEGSYWGRWCYICIPNAHFTYVDKEPPVIKTPFYFFRNNSDKIIQPNASGKVVLSGDIDIVVGIRDAGLYARSKDSGFGDRLSVAKIDYKISPVSKQERTKHQFNSFDFRKINIKKSSMDRKYNTELTKVVYKHWTLFEANRPNWNKVFGYYIITNCSAAENHKELTLGEGNLCWKTTSLDQQGNPVFPDGEYDIVVTVHDFAGNKSSEISRVTVYNNR